MRLDYLRYFDHLAEVLNYTRAAEDLYIAQPTLSVAMKRLEKELGIKLFQRGEGSTRIELTDMGKAYHEYVSLALKDLDKGLRIAREIQGEMNSLVRVGTIYAMQGRFWSEAIESFASSCQTKPQIAIEQALSLSSLSASATETSMLPLLLAWTIPMISTMSLYGPSLWFWVFTKTVRSPSASPSIFLTWEIKRCLPTVPLRQRTLPFESICRKTA